MCVIGLLVIISGNLCDGAAMDGDLGIVEHLAAGGCRHSENVKGGSIIRMRLSLFKYTFSQGYSVAMYTSGVCVMYVFTPQTFGIAAIHWQLSVLGHT